METVEWQLAALVRPREGGHEPKFGLLMLNQPIKNFDLIRDLWQRSSLRVAADGGANQLHAFSQSAPTTFDSLDVIVGDLDSLTSEARAYFESRGTTVVHEPEQDSTDFGKAISYIRGTSASAIDVVAVGGLGGRVDQGISQLHHLYVYQSEGYSRGRMYLVSEGSLTVVLKAGRHVIHVREAEPVFGKHVGILPIREPSVISTKGLRWDVDQWETAIGGIVSTSNEVLPENRVVEVETSKDVLFTISLK